MKMKGFTLIEIVVVLLILGVVSAIFTTVLSEGNRAYLFLSRQNQIIQESRVAMNWMTQELTSEVLLGASHSFTTATATSLQFTRNSDSQVVIYSWTSPTLTRQLGATSRTLASNVTAFTFTYLDASETVTANLPNIATIVINMTIQVGDKSITLKSAVSPRNTGP